MEKWRNGAGTWSRGHIERLLLGSIAVAVQRGDVLAMLTDCSRMTSSTPRMREASELVVNTARTSSSCAHPTDCCRHVHRTARVDCQRSQRVSVHAEVEERLYYQPPSAGGDGSSMTMKDGEALRLDAEVVEAAEAV